MPGLDSERRQFLRELAGNVGAELHQQEGETGLLLIGRAARWLFTHGLILSLA